MSKGDQELGLGGRNSYSSNSDSRALFSWEKGVAWAAIGMDSKRL